MRPALRLPLEYTYGDILAPILIAVVAKGRRAAGWALTRASRPALASSSKISTMDLTRSAAHAFLSSHIQRPERSGRRGFATALCTISYIATSGRGMRQDLSRTRFPASRPRHPGRNSQNRASCSQGDARLDETSLVPASRYRQLLRVHQQGYALGYFARRPGKEGFDHVPLGKAGLFFMTARETHGQVPPTWRTWAKAQVVMAL